MNQKIIFAVLMCLATGAAGFSFGSHEPDFHALDKYLSSELFDNNDLTQNVNLVRERIDKLKGATKEAAKIVLELADSDGDCNQHLFDTLNKIHAGGVGSLAVSRIEKVLGPLMAKASEGCPAVVEQQVEESSRALPASLVEFASKVSPSYGSGPEMDDDVNRSLSWNAHTYFIKFGEVIKVFNQLADENIKSIKDHEKKLAKATLTFEEKLVAPCGQIVDALGGAFENARLIYNVRWNSKTFVSQRSDQFKNLAWTYRFCQVVSSNAKPYKALIFDQLML